MEDPNSWRVIRVAIEYGEGYRVEADLLRGPEWITEYHPAEGGTVFLDLPEMGVEGLADVVAVDPCPEIEPGSGCVVVSQFRHQRGKPQVLVVEGAEDPLHPTPLHPFWCENKQDWISAEDLESGNLLRDNDGNLVKVVENSSSDDEQPVFNVEVDADHVYRVGESGILVHNLSWRCKLFSEKYFGGDYKTGGNPKYQAGTNGRAEKAEARVCETGGGSRPYQDPVGWGHSISTLAGSTVSFRRIFWIMKGTHEQGSKDKTTMKRTALLLTARLLVPVIAVLAASHVLDAQEKSVRPGINKSFKDPNLKKFIGLFEREGRDAFDHRHEIVKATGLKPGMAVADIGSGTGLFTRLFSPAVGSKGRVYAVDISKKFVKHVEKTAREKGLTNITGVVCRPDAVNLPDASIDVAFICDTYHHFEFPHNTMRSIHRALKPGGQVVLIDFERIEGKTSKWVMGHVRAGQKVFTSEIIKAGFRQVEEKKGMLSESYFVRFKKIPAANESKRGKSVALFDGKTLDGWTIRGGFAKYTVKENMIVGTTAQGSPNTFLCKGPFSDFVLEFDVLCDEELNSGVQIRSHVYQKNTPRPGNPKHIQKKGSVYGYQCEIARAAGGTSGNFWDEARRGKWLDNFSNKPEARKAFKAEQWNHYRIVARGDHIRSWINGVACADFHDKTDASGFIGLQVHGISKGTGPFQVRWKNIRIQELKSGEDVK